jgi:hypothetical protein
MNTSRQFTDKIVDSVAWQWISSLLDTIRYFISLLGRALGLLFLQDCTFLDECGGIPKAKYVL